MMVLKFRITLKMVSRHNNVLIFLMGSNNENITSLYKFKSS